MERKFESTVLSLLFTILIAVWAIFLKAFNLFSSITAFIITVGLIVCYLVFLITGFKSKKRKGNMEVFK